MSVLLDLIYLVVALAASPWWARKARSGWRERFGRVEPLPAADGPRLLIHAVSVGEVNLIRLLVERLRGDVEVVVSVTTDTGIARARELYDGKPNVRVVRYPLDASWMVRRFLNAVRPDGAALVELELWPNFARACAARGIPVAIINGRLSDRSHGRYRMARPVVGRWFRSLAFIAVQDEVYRDRFISVGAAPQRCSVVGSMKWDTARISDQAPGAEDLAEWMGIDRSRPLIVAGSTAPDEHRLLHEATPPGVQLLCAPRKPEGFDEAARDLPGCIRRSGHPGDEGGRGAGGDRFLLDTIGELRMAYALADVVVVGRSFGSLYGSDPMEPAALGKPVVIGPAVDDFATIVAAMKHDGALVQTTREELAAVLRDLLDDVGKRESLGAAGRACVARHQGATEEHARMLLAMLHHTTDEPSGGEAPVAQPVGREDR